MKEVKVRFAPSPTGYLHIGGARTALFNFLYAQKQGGKFLLRIEDTDRERSKPEFEKEILDSLRWLGMKWEGVPMRQSERLSIYHEQAQVLISKGLAYEEEKDGKKAVLFKMPGREIKFIDGLRGEIRFDTKVFEDLVMIKSDGFPTYHWACVVDDHAMEVTHVMRGEDHLTNTAKHILLFEALGWPIPHYVHLPLILGSDGTPLSKRHGAVAVLHYQKEGFLAEGLFNYLALLGWGPEGNQEVFRLQDLVQKFTLKRLIKSAARFDLEKLRWVNAQHLKNLTEDEYLKRIRDFFSNTPLPSNFDQIALLFRSRIQTFKDLITEASYCFKEVETYDLEAMNQALAASGIKQKLEELYKAYVGLSDFNDLPRLESILRASAARQGTEAKVLIHPLRLALTGKSVSPGIFELMKVFGKNTALVRLRQLIDKL